MENAMTRQRSSDLAESTTVSIRFPDKIYKWLKDKSDNERRSFNAQVLLELEQVIERDTTTTAPTQQ